LHRLEPSTAKCGGEHFSDGFRRQVGFAPWIVTAEFAKTPPRLRGGDDYSRFRRALKWRALIRRLSPCRQTRALGFSGLVLDAELLTRSFRFRTSGKKSRVLGRMWSALTRRLSRAPDQGCERALSTGLLLAFERLLNS
jgi:hypothetical protein